MSDNQNDQQPGNDSENDFMAELNKFLADALEKPQPEKAKQKKKSKPDPLGDNERSVSETKFRKSKPRPDHYDKEAEYKELIVPILEELDKACDDLGIPYLYVALYADTSSHKGWNKLGNATGGPCEMTAMHCITEMPHDFSHMVITACAVHKGMQALFENHDDDEGESDEGETEE